MSKKEDTKEAPEQKLESYEKSVQFINKSVLKPKVKPIKGTAKTIADQAAAMMIQDVRGFLQGSEQVLTVAMAKAAKLTMNAATLPEGVAALEALSVIMNDLTEFAGGIGKTASIITYEFDGKTKPTAPTKIKEKVTIPAAPSPLSEVSKPIETPTASGGKGISDSVKDLESEAARIQTENASKSVKHSTDKSKPSKGFGRFFRSKNK